MVTKVAFLPDRGAVQVTGEDAGKLLGGLVTNDMDALDERPAIFAGLLSPQGKILFDFFIVKVPGGFVLEVARDHAAALAKRLTLYKLRAAAEIADVSADYRVLAAWDGHLRSHGAIAGMISYPDPRLPELGLRVLAKDAVADGIDATAEAYHAHRIGLGVPEGGKDYVFGDTFPHEALFDQLHGVSFIKGCYVGQEVVSRMQHRTTVRKRVVPVVAVAGLPSAGADVLAGDVSIGTLGSVAGRRGLALVRLDRAADFKARGVVLSAGGIAIEVERPAFATFTLEAPSEAAP